MNDLIQTIRRFITGAGAPVSISDVAVQRYYQCVEEWNTSYWDDAWCDSPRGQDCKDYIDWFHDTYE